MAVRMKDIAPGEIEQESFRIIEGELERLRETGKLAPASFSPEESAVLRRMIHASGDFDFARIVRFHPRAVEAGMKAVCSGRDVLVDVNMAVQGVSRKILEGFGGRVLCYIGDERAARLAAREGITRAEAGMELAAERGNVGIVAVGNAPTALARTIKMVREKRLVPDLIIGVPVGFVNAEESKEMLIELDHPFITARGRKGGTPIAVSAVNAILRLCGERNSG